MNIDQYRFNEPFDLVLTGLSISAYSIITFKVHDSGRFCQILVIIADGNRSSIVFVFEVEHAPFLKACSYLLVILWIELLWVLGVVEVGDIRAELVNQSLKFCEVVGHRFLIIDSPIFGDES